MAISNTSIDDIIGMLFDELTDTIPALHCPHTAIPGCTCVDSLRATVRAEYVRLVHHAAERFSLAPSSGGTFSDGLECFHSYLMSDRHLAHEMTTLRNRRAYDLGRYRLTNADDYDLSAWQYWIILLRCAAMRCDINDTLPCQLHAVINAPYPGVPIRVPLDH